MDHINGLRVDSQAIGRGLYALICKKGDEAIVAFGMIPQWVIDSLRPMLREKIISEGAKQHGLEASDVQGCLDEKAIKRTMQDIEREVVLAIYDAAKQAGMLMV